MANPAIGHVTCKHCGYDEAEVKETKKQYQGKALVMVWCPHPKCMSQHFPRSKEASEKIRAEMRPVSNNPPSEVAPPVQENAPAPVPQRKSFGQFIEEL
jgi:hypothetical protein